MEIVYAKSSKSFEREENDCTVLAMQHAFDITYSKAHLILAAYGRKPRQGFHLLNLLRKWYGCGLSLNRRIVKKFISCGRRGYRVQSFLSRHKHGSWIIGVRAHVFCVKDGVIYDSTKGEPVDKNSAITYFFEIALDS